MAVFIGGVLAWEKPTYNGLHYPGTAFFCMQLKMIPMQGIFCVVDIKMRKINVQGMWNNTMYQRQIKQPD